MGNGVVNGSALRTVRVAVTDMLKALFCMAFVEEKNQYRSLFNFD